jgi:ATP-dependent RNA helicase SUPV3L1/SUV3
MIPAMSNFARSPLAAVLGPTNTGKTHLAVERMMGHASGMIGFPLRLLAREVYDRVVAAKGKASVGLITGEEKILPETARWLLCTAESMPRNADVAFAAIDEAQLAADPERGHVFTDRLLHCRGREETMILGSDSLRPMLKVLTPDAEIISRPRFSTLSYSGSTKLSRLPPRSAIVAFSTEEVYAVAEMLRRLRGGAAVVMGALSPRTRNAQVAMFQAGEVDYIVATDAIGMGLNMDVHHVAFASLSKFDGRKTRRLLVHEMAQIAGRAGRHQRDGTFGTLSLEDQRQIAFKPEEVERIEAHEFPWLQQIYWREGSPSFASLDTLIADLELHPQESALRATPENTDLTVLKMLAAESWVRDRLTPMPASSDDCFVIFPRAIAIFQDQSSLRKLPRSRISPAMSKPWRDGSQPSASGHMSLNGPTGWPTLGDLLSGPRPSNSGFLTLFMIGLPSDLWIAGRLC